MFELMLLTISEGRCWLVTQPTAWCPLGRILVLVQVAPVQVAVQSIWIMKQELKQALPSSHCTLQALAV
jgi:hypothetical protein